MIQYSQGEVHSKMEQLTQITENIWLKNQMAGTRKDGSRLVNVCVKSENGIFAALDVLTYYQDGNYFYNEKNLGAIGSDEFNQYLKKFQVARDIVVGKPRTDESELYKSVSASYAETKSIKRTARELKLSEERTRRILFTTGDYTCDIHEKVMAALQEGKTLDDAADTAGISRKKIHAYLPYTE